MIRNEKGFTLIELMVVVLIIGILVAIAIPAFNNTADNAKNKACTANVRAIAGAASQYQAENSGGNWPADVQALVTAGFLKGVPLDPHDSTWVYTISNTGTVRANAGHATPIQEY